MALINVLGSEIDLITLEPWESAAQATVVDRATLAQTWAEGIRGTIAGLIGGMNPVDVIWSDEFTPIPTVSPGGLAGIPLIDPNIADLIIPIIDEIDFDVPPPLPLDEELIVEPAPDPDFNIIPYEQPERPEDNWPVFNEDEPVLTPYTVRPEPDLFIPDPINITDRVVPEVPEYNIPDFDVDEPPTEDLDMPDTMFVYNEAEYNSDLRQQLADKLAVEIATGGTGLGPGIYEAILARRESKEQDVIDKILNWSSDRLHTLPPGMMDGKVEAANIAVLRSRTDHNNDVLIQESKLAQENTHFIIDRAIMFEKNIMDYINRFQDRQLEAAKFAVLSVIEVYKTRAAIYTAKLEAYKVRAQIYMTRVQAELVKAEFYKAQIEGFKALVSYDLARVEVYRAQLAASQTRVELYKALLEADNMQLQQDALRVNLYGMLVKTFEVLTNAQTARWNGYQAQIAGEVAKVQHYKTQVDAYNSRIQAYATEINALVEEYRGHIAGKQSEVEVFKARLQEYTTTSAVAMEQVKAETAIEGLKVEVYTADTRKFGTQVDGLARLYAGRVEQARNQSAARMQRQDLRLKEGITEAQLTSEQLRDAIKTYATMASAAISGFSASAHIGYAESRSDTQSTSLQESHIRNRSDQLIIQHVHRYEHD